MDSRRCPCVIASPTEQEMGTVSASHEDWAVRVRVEAGRDGYVRLEQLGHSADLGWYTQKSFCIPAEMLDEVMALVRKARCLLPAAEPQAPETLKFPTLTDPRPERPLRRRNA